MADNITCMTKDRHLDNDNSILSTRLIIAGFLLILAVTVLAGGTLYWLYPPPDGTRALDIIRTAGSLGVGTGGAAALLLTARRQQSIERANAATQRLSEQTNAITEHDATERRITELLGQAGDQLASEKAVVRQIGLRQLERLGEDYPDHRQHIVDIICGYLRMPFTLPDGAERGKSDPLSETADVEPAKPHHNEGTEELQVRLTAQNILATHLRWRSGAR